MKKLFNLSLNKINFWLILLIPMLFFIHSCKKEILSSSNSLKRKDMGIDIKNISYNQFLSSINLNNTGALKSTLIAGGNKNQQSIMSISDELPGLNINADSVRKLTVKDTISYVISIKPQTPRAIAFQNITIQIAKGKTTAFLSTYIPTKEWIVDYQKRIRKSFKGNISIHKINLQDFNINSNTNLLPSKGKIASINSKSNAIINKISLAPGECEIYDVLEPYQCYYGHWPDQNCDYNAEDHEWFDFPPGYNYVSTVINCAPELPSPPGSGGNGGGGNTTPYPPGQYDPCTGLPIATQSYVKVNGGLKLAIVPPPPCDEGGGGEGGGGLYPLPQIRQEIKMDTLSKNFPCVTKLVIAKLAENYVFQGMMNPFQQTGSGVPNLIWGNNIQDWGGGVNNDKYSLGTTDSGPGWSSNINLNTKSLQNASKLFIATSAIHEIAHAYSNYLIKKGYYQTTGNMAITTPMNRVGSWAMEVGYYTYLDSVSKAGQTNYIDHSNFLETYFDIMVESLKQFDNNSRPINEYRMAMLYGMNNPGDDPSSDPNATPIEINSYIKRKAKLNSIYNKIITNYSINTTTMNNFHRDNTRSNPISNRMTTNCP